MARVVIDVEGVVSDTALHLEDRPEIGIIPDDGTENWTIDVIKQHLESYKDYRVRLTLTVISRKVEVWKEVE